MTTKLRKAWRERLKFPALLFFAALLLPAAGALNAQVPSKVNFQGRLVEGGTPVNAQRNFIFRIYDAAADGNLIWTSQTHNVAVTNGVFSVVLQTGAPVNLSTETFTGARYVSVSVGGVTLAPRQELLSAPYALMAQGLSSTSRVSPAVLAAGALGTGVVASSIAVNAVSTASIRDASVTFAKIALNGCGPAEIMKMNAANTAWECALDASGAGGGSVTLAPSIPDVGGSVDASIYIDDGGGGDLIRLLQAGTDKFRVDNAGNAFIVGYTSSTKYYGDGSELTGLGAAAADDLGNHTATQDLDMAGFGILLAPNVMISSEPTAAKGGGVAVSSHVYADGSYYGAAAAITGAVNAGYYQINGSSVLAVLPGAGSLGVGLGAGWVNTGSNNIFAGAGAGYAARTGGSNAVFGVQAGYGAGAGTFSSSTLVGYQAGYGLTTGGDNIFVGFKAGYAVTTGTGNIIIGYNQGASAPAANNEINVGGVYKGNISSGTATIPKFTVRAVTGDTAAAFGETIAVNSAVDVIVTLPAVTAADIGATVTVLKLGAGKVTLAANGTPIADSAAAGTIYNNAFLPPYASIMLRLADVSRWSVLSGEGAWITTGP